ncbi:glutamine amidotransferase [Klebsiella pneumoniae]|nr:glutamine amidotransferase [Klebsiella pneumoniae]
MLSLLKKGPSANKVPAEKIQATYGRYRMQALLSVFLGYLAYYIVRNNFTLSTPYLKEHNEVEMHPEGKLLASVAGTGHPLLAVREYQQGRSLVWTSDMSAHWLPEEFAKWPGYRQLWINCLDWLTERR